MFALICEKTKESAVIDPSFTNRNEFDAFWQYLDDHGAKIRHILLTHGHPDHVAGVSETLREWPDASLHLHPQEEENYYTAQELAAQLGLPFALANKLPDPTNDLKDGDMIKIGEKIELHVIHTPGHAPGHVAFVDSRPCPERKMGQVLMSGDLLFRGSVGRTDLHNGSVEDLLASIRRLYELHDESSMVLSGHTTPTTLQREKGSNPFVDISLKRPKEWYEEAEERHKWVGMESLKGAIS
jgi:glyoxylase-like metal-dependent hydrolase (beta-lactamase superfamily II)